MFHPWGKKVLITSENDSEDDIVIAQEDMFTTKDRHPLQFIYSNSDLCLTYCCEGLIIIIASISYSY